MRTLFETTLIGVMMALFLASSAEAVEVQLLTPSTVTVAPGGSFTVELAVDNASLSLVNGITVDMTGLAGNEVATSGVSAQSYFVDICTPTQCLGGLPSGGSGGLFDPSDLVNSALYSPGDDSIRVVSALGNFDLTTSGAVDPGIANVWPDHDPTDVSLVLQVVGTSNFSLTVHPIANSQANGEDILDTFVINVVVPEPGTALLAGLGLLALASLRRGSRRPV